MSHRFPQNHLRERGLMPPYELSVDQSADFRLNLASPRLLTNAAN